MRGIHATLSWARLLSTLPEKIQTIANSWKFPENNEISLKNLEQWWRESPLVMASIHPLMSLYITSLKCEADRVAKEKGEMAEKMEIRRCSACSRRVPVFFQEEADCHETYHPGHYAPWGK